MPRFGKDSRVISIAVSQTLHDAVVRLAAAEGVSVSAWCRDRLREDVDEFLHLNRLRGERKRAIVRAAEVW